ncbi:MAG: hypothetical protein GX220_00525 [Treponema sp.]|nr:hypothetical protein [Treponema sp.]
MSDLIASKVASQSTVCKVKSEKIYCANCINCKLVTSPAGEGQFYLRVRCAADKWKKKLGEEKIYKYFTVSRRSIDYCEAYEPMGDTEEYMRDLRKSLPSKDESYDRF